MLVCAATLALESLGRRDHNYDRGLDWLLLTAVKP